MAAWLLLFVPAEYRCERVGVGLYESYVLPKLLDVAMRQKPIMMQRDKVVPRARGQVLEIGIGSGLNLACYDVDKVEKVWGLDPSLELGRMATKRAAATSLDVELLQLSSEEIPVDDQRFDTVLVTYTLCTIPDAAKALGEMYRVLRSDGELIFCEHGAAPDVRVARWQNRLNPYWKNIAGGCNLNRKIPDLIAAAGFDVSSLETMYLPGPKPMTYNYWGSAKRK